MSSKPPSEVEAAVRALRDAACDDSLYDGHLEWDRRAAQGIAKVDSLAELCSGADALSIHAILNDETRGLVDAPKLATDEDMLRFLAMFRKQLFSTVA